MKTAQSRSRRDFLKRSGLSALAFSLTSAVGTTAAAAPTPPKLSERSRRFMDMFGLKYPIVQAPTGGPAGNELAIAVSNAGAFGALPLTWDNAEWTTKNIGEVKRRSTGSFFGNYLLQEPPSQLEVALDAGVETVQFSWGLPGPDAVQLLRDRGVKMGIQVVSKPSAQHALELQPDYLVCQGMEAGGHVHGSMPLMKALEDVLAVAGDVPVLASGGIAHGKTIRQYLDAGAAGTVSGSRFVATQESNAHPDYLDALVEADGDDTVFTVCMNKGWDNATHRILRNSTFTKWEAAGCPKAGARPGEHDIVATAADGGTQERYVPTPPLNWLQGDVMALAPYAGQGVGHIVDIPPAGQAVERLWQEYLAA